MTALTAQGFPRTANDRLKEGFEVTLALSFGVALALHALVFKLWPAMEVQPWSVPADAVELLHVDEIDLPPEPKPLIRPRLPVAATDVSIPDDATISVPDWKEAATLPPPPPDAATEATGAAIPWTPYTVPPHLTNPDEAARLLQREYPPLLRDAGIGGTVGLLVHIDATGRVLEARVGQSSGKGQLDDAALRVVDGFRFTPALNRDLAVAVWVRIPVTFQVH